MGKEGNLDSGTTSAPPNLDEQKHDQSQMQPQGATARSLQWPMASPVQNAPQVSQQKPLPLQSHLRQLQAMMHQGQGSGNMGIAIPSPFPHQQPGEWGGRHKTSAVKTNVITSTTQCPTFMPPHLINYHQPLQPKIYHVSQMPGIYNVSQMPGIHNVSQMPGIHNVSQMFYTKPTSLPMSSTQMDSLKDHQKKPIKRDTRRSQQLHQPDASSSVGCTKLPTSKTVKDSTVADAIMQEGSKSPGNDQLVSGPDASTSTINSSSPGIDHGKQIHGVLKEHQENENEALGRKKYSRDLLLVFSEQCRDLPLGFEIGADMVDALMTATLGGKYIVDRIIDRSPKALQADRRTACKWRRASGSFGPGRDLLLDVSHGAAAVSSRAGKGVSQGVSKGLVVPSPQTPAQEMHKAATESHTPLKSILNESTPHNFEKLCAQVEEVNIANTVSPGIMNGMQPGASGSVGGMKLTTSKTIKDGIVAEVNMREGSSLIEILSSSSDSNDEVDNSILDYPYQLSSDVNKLSLFDLQEEDVSIVAERSQVACRDYPHSRNLCVKYPFSKTDHEIYCSQCYCYVCNIVAPCEYWQGTTGHCHACD